MKDNDNDFENQIIIKATKYFSTNQYVTRTKIDTFLSNIGLLDIWSSEEEKNFIWEFLKKFSSNKDSINKEDSLKAIKELLTSSENITEDKENVSIDARVSQLVRESILNQNPNPKAKKKKDQRLSVTKFINNINIDKIRQFRQIFSILDIQNKGFITLTEIQELPSKYKFLTISQRELIEFLTQISDYSNQDSIINDGVIKINFELYSKAISLLENQILNSNINFFPEAQNESYEITQDPIEMVDSLVNMEQETMDYLGVLGDMKNLLQAYNYSINDSYIKILNKEFIGGNTESTLHEDINKENALFSKKINEIDLFVQEMNKGCKKKQSKLEYFKMSLKNLIQNNRDLEEDYKQIYLKFINNQQIDNDDEVNKLIEENRILNKQIDEKTAKIEKMQKVIEEKEDNINSLIIKYNQLQEEKRERIEDIKRLNANNAKLRKDYNLMVNEILEKIKRQNELGQTIKDTKEIAKDDNDTISQIEEKMLFSDKINEISKMSHENLLKYCFKVDSDNENLLTKFSLLEEKIKELEQELKETKGNLNFEKQNSIILKAENNRMRSEIQDLKQDIEINSMFRPSKMMNKIRISQMNNNNGNRNTSNIQMFDKSPYVNEVQNPFTQSKQRNDISISKISKIDINENAININYQGIEDRTGNEGLNVKERDKLIQKSTLGLKEKETIQKTSVLIKEEKKNWDHIQKGPFMVDPNSQITQNEIQAEDEGKPSFSINKNFRNSSIEECINLQMDKFEFNNNNNLNNNQKENISSSIFQKETINRPSEINTSKDQYINPKKEQLDLQITSNSSHYRSPTINDISVLLEKENPSHVSKTGYDFLSLRKNTTIQNLLDENNDTSNSYEMFSDNVFMLGDNDKKKAKILFITCSFIYILRPKNYTIKTQFETKKLIKFTISNTNCNMIVFHFNKGEGLIIDIFRRLELLYYFNNLYKLKGYGKISFRYDDAFNIKANGYYVTKEVNLRKDAITQNFQNAIKLDYLQKMTEGFFSYSFSEKLVVLTSIGLLYFDDPTKPPKKLIPIVGSKIIRCEEEAYRKKYCFEIWAMNKEHIVFAAKTEEDLNDWMNEFDRMKKDFKESSLSFDRGKN